MRIACYFNSFLVLAALFLTAVACDLSAEEYRGFPVDYSEVRSSPDFETLPAAMNKQIDMVLAVDLPENILGFFQRVPLRVRAGKESWAGHYTGQGSKDVALTSGFLSRGHKPALLHEFLHAYHDQRIAGGFRNREVLMYYERAKASNKYDSKSHMMANVREYFASASTAYLFGVTELEPFTRAKVKTSQPRFYEFLSSLFGPNAGQYHGSIERSRTEPKQP